MAVAQDMLGDLGFSNAVQVGSGRMAEKTRVEGLCNSGPIGCFSEDVLKSPLRDAFTAL